MATPSNSKQRQIAKSWCGENVKVEDCPFKFPITGYKGKFEIKTAPFAYVEDLPTHIFGYLEKLDE